MNNENKTSIFQTARGVFLILLSIGCCAIGLKFFVYSANIIPGGFTGLGILIQKLLSNFLHIEIPLTLINVCLNIGPAIFAYKIIGKKFTILSFAIMFSITFIVDLIPKVTLTTNPLLAAMFGGILCGFCDSTLYRCGVSEAGTDFISMSVASKYHIQIFSYVMAFSIVIIFIQGILFGLEPAFYSVVYQFIYRTTVKSTYRHYEARTILIITDKPNDVADILITNMKHSSTVFNGIGSYTKKEKFLLYTIVTQPEVRKTIALIKKADSNAFINIVQSNEVQGNFYYLPVDVNEINYK